MRKPSIIVGIFIIAVLIAGSIYYFFGGLSPIEQKPSSISGVRQPCLSDDKTAIYTIDKTKEAGPADIIIKEKKSGKEIYKFTIDSVWRVAYPIQLRKCGIYVLRIFNFDPKLSKQPPGYKDEIWYYTYDGKGTPLLLLSFKDESGVFHSFFSPEFKVDFLEVYMALIKGYLGTIDFATIIKEIKTKNDIFSLEHNDIVEKHTDVSGVFAFYDWTKDSRYFWGRLQSGSVVTAFFRIERGTWNVDIFVPEVRILGGTAFNEEYGYVTYDTGPGWIGIQEHAEQVYKEWRKEGKIVEFYLYNLFTKEKTLLAISSEPSWNGNPQWLSDTELEYYLPTGEKKIFVVK